MHPQLRRKVNREIISLDINPITNKDGPSNSERNLSILLLYDAFRYERYSKIIDGFELSFIIKHHYAVLMGMNLLPMSTARYRKTMRSPTSMISCGTLKQPVISENIPYLINISRHYHTCETIEKPENSQL